MNEHNQDIDSIRYLCPACNTVSLRFYRGPSTADPSYVIMYSCPCGAEFSDGMQRANRRSRYLNYTLTEQHVKNGIVGQELYDAWKAERPANYNGLLSVVDVWLYRKLKEVDPNSCQ